MIVIVIVGIFFMTAKSMQCTYPGCDKRRESGSEYCLEHKPDGEEEESKKEDPYHARDYGDVEDFYYDYFDDFESFDDAETYFEDVQNE